MPFDRIIGQSYDEPVVSDRDLLGDLELSIHFDIREIEAPWKSLEASSRDPFSDYAWVSSWCTAQHDNPDVTPFVILGKSSLGKPMFVLPLVREQRGSFSVITWPGNKHAAYHVGLFSQEIRNRINERNAGLFWKQVFKMLPKADALVARGVSGFEISRGNPLSHLTSFKSEDNSEIMRLQPCWEELYLAKTNSKTRSNDRRCEKRLGETGKLSFRIVEDHADRKRVLNSLMVQKSIHFREMNVPDFFMDSQVREFYLNLVSQRQSEEASGAFLAVLELDGEPVAVNLGIRKADQFFGLILSMKRGQHTKFAPGRLVLLKSMEHLCELGISNLDFGVGALDYKTAWADESQERWNVTHPFTLKGGVYITILRLVLKLRSMVRSSPKLERLFTKYRKFAKQ